MNNTKRLFQRIYSALTIGLLSAFLMISSIPFSFDNLSYIDIGINMLLSLGICWIATRQNEPVHFKYYAGIMLILMFLYVYIPRLVMGSSFLYADYVGGINQYLGWITFGSCWVCIVISAYLSNTKYYNIFPNQNKVVSYLFRGLSWIGQVIVWGVMLLVLLAVIGVFK